MGRGEGGRFSFFTAAISGLASAVPELSLNLAGSWAGILPETRVGGMRNCEGEEQVNSSPLCSPALARGGTEEG